MSNNVRLSRGFVPRVIGISALIAILSVAGCSTNGAKTFAVVTTSAQIPAAVVNTAYAGATLTAANGTVPYTWTITSGALPAGMTMSTAGAISGTPTQSGTASFTVQAKDSATPAHTATASLTLNVNQVPAITSGNSTTFTAGASGTFTVTATGFPAPTFSETGALPTGVTLNATSGVLAGTPGASTGGTYPITITAQNGVTPNATQAFTLTVNQAPAITSANSVGFASGVQSTFTVTASAFPAPTFSETGQLPAGITFNTTTGVLSGTTSAQGSFSIVFGASNGIGANASQNFTLIVGVAPAITSGNSVTFTVGTLGTFTVTATGSPVPTFSEAGALPTGVTLNATTGVLSGTPAVGTGGSYAITLTAQNSVPPNATQSFTLTVDEAPSITSQNSTTFTLGSNGTFKVTTTGNPTATITETGALPSGVTFVDNGNDTATLSGTPATGTAGPYSLTIGASNGIGTAASQSFTLTVSATPPCASGNESLLTGQYAFLLRGFDSFGNVALIGGVLTADGAGNLTAGAVDMNLSTAVSNLAIASGSTYQIGSDGRGCMGITATAGTQNYRFSLAASGNGHMIDFDAAGPFTTGVLRKQTASAFSTAQISGNYAFGVSSPQDSGQGGGKFGAIGVLNFSAGSVTGGSVDYNSYNANTSTDTIDGSTTSTAWPTSSISINSGGSYTVSGTNGRGTLTFTPSGGSAVNAYIYVVSASEALLVSSDVRTVNNPFAGTAFKQSGGPYSTSSLSGKSVLYNSKISNNGGTPNSSSSLGIVTTTGATAAFTFAGYSNDGGTVSTPTNNSAAGTFSVSSNGRVTLTVSGGGGNQTPEFYLYSPGSAFALFSGTGVDDGIMELQTTTTAANATYSAGGFNPQTAGVSDKESVVTLASGNASSTDDDNSQGTLTPGSTGSSTYSVDSTGVFFLPASCTPNTNCEKIGTVVTGSKIIIMDAKSSSTQGGTTNPTLQDLEQ
jgi:large repetitive protein